MAQPLLDIFGRAPDHFIFRGVHGAGVLLFGLAATLAVPGIAYLVEFTAGLVSHRARTVMHQLFIGVLAAAFLTLLFDGILERLAALTAALVVAGLFVLAYERTRGVRIWLGYLAPAPIVFLLIFLVASPAAPLLRGSADALDVRVGRPTPTVIVLFDEFPLVTLLDEDGDIDADLFPNFARLGETSHWFRQATTVSNTTTIAAPALLTGNLPTANKTPDSSSYPNNLFTLLGGTMPVTSSEVITMLCPSSVCEQLETGSGGLTGLLGDAGDVLAQRLSPTDPDRDPMTALTDRAGDAPARAEGADEVRNRAADGGVERFERFLDALDDDPGLHFLHLLLPHGPYRLLPDGMGYAGPKGLGRTFDDWTGHVPPVTVARQQFLLQLQWTDHLLGRLLDELTESGLLDRANLIVVADHGYGFEPGGTFRAREIEDGEDERTIAEILWIPFFVKAAGQTEGEVSDDPVRIVDVVPTVAELLDVDIPWEVDGRSVFDGGSGSPDEVGLYRIIGDTLPGEDAYRSFPRQRSHDLLMDRTTGAFAPPGDGISGSDRIHRIGPRPDLYGRPVPDGLDTVELDLHEDSRADDVSLASGQVPALVQARIPDLPADRTVAIAVNGTVWATATTYGRTPASIAAILPTKAFRDGPNTITAHPLD